MWGRSTASCWVKHPEHPSNGDVSICACIAICLCTVSHSSAVASIPAVVMSHELVPDPCSALSRSCLNLLTLCAPRGGAPAGQTSPGCTKLPIQAASCVSSGGAVHGR